MSGRVLMPWGAGPGLYRRASERPVAPVSTLAGTRVTWSGPFLFVAADAVASLLLSIAAAVASAGSAAGARRFAVGAGLPAR